MVYRTGLLLLMVATPQIQAASFSFGAVVRAGNLVNFNTGELFLGVSSGLPDAWSNAFFVEGQSTPFTLSWDGDTNTAQWASAWANGSSSGTSTVSWNPTGGDLLNPGLRTWTIAPGGIALSALSKPLATSIQITFDSITGTGLSVLQPFSPSSFTASQNGGADGSDSNPAAVVFTTSGSGSWLLSGTIRFTGLSFWNVGGAVNDQLRFAFDISGSQDSPEPATLLMVALGFAVIAVVRSRKRWRARHSKSGKQSTAQ